MARAAAGHATERQTPTAIPRLTIWYSHVLTEPTPAIFAAKFYLLLQGRKSMTIGGRSVELGPGDYALSAVGLPFKGQIIEASPVTPYVGVELALDPAVVASLLVDMPDLGKGEAPTIAVAPVTQDIAAPVERLLRLLSNPADVAVLAPQLERELYYRILQGPSGGTLRQVVQQSTRFQQIGTAIRWICDNADKPLHVTALADAVGMSTTSFHRHFKSVTAHTPLAYQRYVRLSGAQRLLAAGATSVTRTAFSTGYASPSQFSREYKRMFGTSPKEARLMR